MAKNLRDVLEEDKLSTNELRDILAALDNLCGEGLNSMPFIVSCEYTLGDMEIKGRNKLLGGRVYKIRITKEGKITGYEIHEKSGVLKKAYRTTGTKIASGNTVIEMIRNKRISISS